MKSLFFFILAAGFAVSAQASYLFWQVDSGTEVNQYAIDNDYGYARLRMFDNVSGTRTTADFQNDDIVAGVNGTVAPVKLAADFDNSIEVSLLEGNSYYIELLAWNGSSYVGVGASTVMSYTELASAGYTYSNADLADIPKLNLKIWNGGAYTVPEPTGALLMVLGLAFLGLKRRMA